MSEPGRPRDPDVDVRILTAARAVLDAEGPDAVTVARVAREAGVGRPTVYRRYADAAELLRGVLFLELQGISDAHADMALPATSVVDAFIAMSTPSIRFYADNLNRSRALMSVALLADPEWQARWDSLNTGIAELGGRAVVAAMHRGELRPDADVVVLVHGFMSIYVGVLLGGLTGAYGGADQWIALLRRLLEQFVSGSLQAR